MVMAEKAVDLKKALKDKFGYTDFRTGLQREAVECVVEGEEISGRGFEREGRKKS